MLIDEISERVASRLNLSKIEQAKLTQINRVQFKFLLDTMQAGNMEGVSIIYLGKFVKNKKYSKIKQDDSTRSTE